MHFLTAAALAALTIFSPVGASATEAPSVSWSIAPSDGAAADGRSWVEHELDPGERITEHAIIRNHGETDAQFSLTAADGYFTDSGRFNMLPANRESVDAGTWIEVQPTVTVAAGASVVVPFTLTVPDDATPGDHAAGIAASILSRNADPNGATIGVESRVGFRVITTVTGHLRGELAIAEATAGFVQSWNPFQPGRIEIQYTAENVGNVQLAYTDAAGGKEAERGDLLPGEARRGSIAFSAWPTFLVPVELTLEGESPTAAVETVRVAQTVQVWAVPYPQLLVLAGVSLVLFAILAGRRRSARRVARLVEEAREAGRREAPHITDRSGATEPL